MKSKVVVGMSLLLIAATLYAQRAGEFLLDTNAVYIGATGGQYRPSVAFDGTNYLVVWYDSREDIYDVYAARVTQSGILIDTVGIAIATAEGLQWHPSVAFDGTNYFVVWQDARTGSNDIYGARVTPAGDVLDPAGLVISDAALGQNYPKVAFDGTNYLVVWQDYRSGMNETDIYCTRVTPSGIVLDTADIAISTATDDQSYPSVAFNGTHYLVTWMNSYDHIYGALVAQSGAVIDTGIVITTSVDYTSQPRTASDGTHYLVTWSDNGNVYGARVDQSGNVLDPTGIPISTATNDQLYPSVAFDGTNFFVAWEDKRDASDIYGARVDTAGTVLDPAGIPIITYSVVGFSSSTPALAFASTNYLVVCRGQNDIIGARVEPTGTVLDPEGILISMSAYGQSSASLAFDGTNYLVVWRDERNYPEDGIYGTRVDQSGTVLDPDGIAISTAPEPQELPSVAFGDTMYLVTWFDWRDGAYYGADIVGTRVDRTGTVLDPTGIFITDDENRQAMPSAASDGLNYLVVWQDDRNGDEDIYGARVDPSGTVLDPTGIPVCTAANLQWYPKAAFDGANYFVVWQDRRNGQYDDNIYGARIDQSGNVLDPTGIPISSAPEDQLRPSLAFDGTNYLVVWQDERNGNDDIYCARVDTAGTLLDPTGIAIFVDPADLWYPNVAFDGTNYLVVWQTEQSGSLDDLYAAVLDPSGTAIDTIALVVEPGNQMHPAVAHGTADSVLIAYTGWTDYINTHPAKTTRIWGTYYSYVGIEEDISHDLQHILQINPNPFVQMAHIRYQLTDDRNTELQIFDATGRLVRQFDYQTMRRFDRITWYGTDDTGKKLPAGVYFCYLKADDITEAKKIIKLK